MFERYTEKARRVIFFARYEASQFGSPYIEVEHLLLGMMREDRGAFKVLGDAPAEKFRLELESRMPLREKISTSVDLPLSEAAIHVLRSAEDEAGDLAHRSIDTCHLLLAVLKIEDSTPAVFLRKHGIEYAGYREQVRMSPPESARSGPPPATLEFENQPPEEIAPIQPEAPSLASSVQTLQRLTSAAADKLYAYSEDEGGQQLKRRPISRKEALGHLVNLAMAHHLWLARALTEARVAAGVYPLMEWTTAQQYRKHRWRDLVGQWTSLNFSLMRVLAAVPEEKANTLIRVGIEEPQTLKSLIDRYTAETDDLIGQILSHL